MSINLSKFATVKHVVLFTAIGLLLIGTSTIAKAAPLAYYLKGGTNEFGIVDLNTGLQTPIATLPNPGYASGFGVANGKLYITDNAYNVYGHLSSINPATGQVSSIGNSGVYYTAFGSTSKGLFAYGTPGPGTLYSVNPTTGAATPLGTVGASGIGVLGSVATLSTSSDSDSLYGLGAYDGYAAFYSINTSSPANAVGLNDTNSAINFHTYYSMLVVNDTLYGILYIMGSGGHNGYGSGNTINPATAVATPYGSYLSSGPEFFWLAPYPLSSPGNAALYFPHVAANLPWQTEIALINTSASQTVTGTLEAFSDAGEIVETKDITLAALGRNEINVADEFTYFAEIRYIVFYTASDSVVGYTKFFQIGQDRAAIPAVKEVNTSDIFITHIASTVDWWTGISLVNTTQAAKQLTITFNTGQSVPYTLQANEHRAFTIESLMGSTQPQLTSAVISNASGVIGLELFGRTGGMNQLDGILLTDQTASTIYYPHVASSQEWWTGIVAYNPSPAGCAITISPYTAQGAALATSMLALAGHEKYVGLVSQLALPAETAWFKIDSTSPLSGFELFGTTDGIQLAAYAGGGSDGAKTGVFAKIEKNGWTGIAFVNMEAGAASVTLTALDDDGAIVATQVLPVAAHAKVVNFAPMIFSQDISTATYITFSSDKNVVGFQLNGSTDGTMLDGLPGLNGGGD